MKKTSLYTALITLSISPAVFADGAANIDDSHNTKIIEQLPLDDSGQVQGLIDLGWDSKYISEGRNNLDKGGIYWATAAVQKDNLTVYATVGRGDSQHYTEWNFGIEYGFELSENLSGSLGYQRLEFYGDERAHDNELFSSLEYTAVDWLVPSVSYTYSTEAAGYFVEVSLHSNWELTEGLSVSPYVTQGFDFQYVTEDHDGPNHFQFGVEAEYLLPNNFVVSGHISHTIAQEDIKLEARNDGITGSLDETFAGLHLSWNF
ncbi:outer membrane beta-barrel protein [Shewanella schlegeliana]|uniref:Outer membrane beta-barrel protein n=1 Tax=Shewanella schlegeliana TaxID=190308 RepID=A0ABS1T1R7_9GAMM|nr:outer membrane beta-barrel protein [Shewanella schlegeliana]MBL4914744.1 outer membrane beta-barrel protein [Shewanella schlegeliana]MCL1109924.1 outer membrane beta-barrel protein [Shewanella schlegeliana]GIU25628.1 hypothetical protein TUM4433_10620 [Shewanella schlegeliana]